MQIEKIKTSDLIPYAKNAKLHSDSQISALAGSLREFGFNNPVLIDKDNGIIAGHGRVLAAQLLKLDEVPCIRLSHLTETQKRAYILADNRLSETGGGWNEEMLKLELGELQTLDFDLSLTGFDGEFITDLNGGTEGLTDPDEVPPVPDEPVAKLGDIWRLGNHRLMCGDSTDKATVEKLMDGVKADMVFTDPPYGMNLDTDFSSMKNKLDFAKEKGFVGGKKYDKGIVDDFDPTMISSILSLESEEMFIWGADYFAEFIPSKNDGSWIVWDKRANGNDDVDKDYSSDKMYGSCFELCWSKKKHKRDIARVKWAGVFGTEQEPDRKRFHPTQKPVGLSAWFLSRYSKDGEKVLDLFGGSGSTLLACEQLNRQCYMMELDPKYCDVIIKRWEDFTGKKAELITKQC